MTELQRTVFLRSIAVVVAVGTLGPQLYALPIPFTAGDLALFQADSSSTNNTTFTIVEVTPSASPTVQTIPINGTSGSNALRTSGSATSTGYLALTDDRSLLSFDAHNSATTSGNANTITARGVGTLDASGSFSLPTTYSGVSGNQARGATSLDDSTWFIADQGGLYTNGAASANPAANLRGIKSFGGTAYALQQSGTATNIVVNTVGSASGGPITGLPGLSNDATAQDFYMILTGNNGANYDLLYVLNNTSATAGTIDKYSLVGGTWVSNGTSTTTGAGGFGLAAAKNGNGADLYFTTGTGATAANKLLKVSDTGGYNLPISINFGGAVTLFTAAPGTTVKGVDFVPVPEPSTLTLACAGMIGMALLRRRGARIC